MVTGAPDYAGITRKVMRADIYEQAMKEIGVAHGGADDCPSVSSTACDVRSREIRSPTPRASR
jgi:uncharacterized membrane protein